MTDTTAKPPGPAAPVHAQVPPAPETIARKRIAGRWTGRALVTAGCAALAGAARRSDIAPVFKYRRMFMEVPAASFFLQPFRPVAPPFFQVIVDKAPAHRILPGLAIVLPLLFAPQPSWAQTPEGRARDQADRIGREEAERLRGERLLQRLERSRPPRSPPQEAPPGQAAPPAQGCVRIHSIAVSGVTVVSRPAVAAAIAPFEGRCLGLADLDGVLKAVTLVYVEAGYVAARAYLTDQDLSDGTLDIVVIEGVLEDIVIDGARRAGTAFPGLVGRPLNLRDIEQGLDQINRLRSKSARIEIRPGERAGGSVLGVLTTTGRPRHLSAASDNLGAIATGRYRSRLNFGYDDIAGLNDHLRLSWQRTMEPHPWAFSGDRPYSDSVSAGLSVPYGYWIFGLDGHWSRYKSEIAGTLGAIGTSGKSNSLSVDIHRVLHRDRTSNTALSATLTRKDNKSYILRSLIDVSSRALAVFSLELTHSRRLEGGVLAGGAGHRFGLDKWGAFNDDEAPAGSPKGQFRKSSAWLRFTRPFTLAGASATWEATLSGQWSPDLLFGSEQMSFGGPGTVRGVREAALFGNRAASMRNEWSVAVPSPDGFLDAATPYAALDCGAVKGQARYGIDGGALCGAAFGLRVSQGPFGFDVYYADLFAGRRHAAAAGQRPGVLSFSLSASF